MPVKAQYARYDSIAAARRAGLVQNIRQELASAEKALASQPINPSGTPDKGRMVMLNMIREDVERKREKIRVIESLTGDELVRYACSDIIAQSEAPHAGEVTINGVPLARGATVQGIAPGMM
jgi:hypothetical protein